MTVSVYRDSAVTMCIFASQVSDSLSDIYSLGKFKSKRIGGLLRVWLESPPPPCPRQKTEKKIKKRINKVLLYIDNV